MVASIGVMGVVNDMTLMNMGSTGKWIVLRI